MLTDDQRAILENAADLLEEKGHAGCELVREMARSSGTLVVYYPAGDESYLQQLQNWIETEKPAERVVLMPWSVSEPMRSVEPVFQGCRLPTMNECRESNHPWWRRAIDQAMNNP